MLPGGSTAQPLDIGLINWQRSKVGLRAVNFAATDDSGPRDVTVIDRMAPLPAFFP
jgi:hypothetical protein